MVLDVLAVLLKLQWQATRKQQDSDGKCTILPKAGSAEHLYDMETAGQMFSTTDTWLRNAVCFGKGPGWGNGDLAHTRHCFYFIRSTATNVW